jgi:hypothetical protein
VLTVVAASATPARAKSLRDIVEISPWNHRQHCRR